MFFKICITIVDSDRPYLVHLAIPDGRGRFIVYCYEFSSGTDATIMLVDYFNNFRRDPDSILEFHRVTSENYRKQLELPFGNI